MIDTLPAPGPATLEGPPPRRRWKRWSALIVLAAIFGAGLWYVITTQTYELRNGGYTRVDPGSGGFQNSTLRGDLEYQFAVRPGGQATFTYSIQNPGPFSVHVNGIVAGAVFTIDQVRINDPSRLDRFDLVGPLPAEGVDLAPGQILALEVTIGFREDVPFAPCTRLLVDELPVRYTVLGTPREQPVDLGFLAAFTFTGDSGATAEACPTAR